MQTAPSRKVTAVIFRHLTRTLLPLAPFLAACAGTPAPAPRETGDPPLARLPAPAGAAQPPEAEKIEIPPVAEAVSADGRYRLQIEQPSWPSWRRPDGTRRLMLQLTLKGLGPEEFLAWRDPLRRVVAGDGAERPRRPAWEEIDRVNLSSSRGEFTTVIDLAPGTTKFARLEYEVAVLRATSWEECVLELPAAGRSGPVRAEGFAMTGEAGPRTCAVGVRQEGTALLDPGWAAERLDVRDATGSRLEQFGGAEPERTWFALPAPEGGLPGPLVPPVTARLRVPREFEIEQVRFEFRDLALVPPVVGPSPGSETVGPEVSPGPGMAWTPWTAPVHGLSMRALLPTAARRGDAVPVRVRLRFDPAGLLPGVTCFDGRALEDRLRMHFEDPVTGARVDLEDDDAERALTRIGPHDGPSGPVDPLLFPIRPAEVREWEVEFSLARAWDALGPGEWRVRASLDVAGEWRGTSSWQGRIETGPVVLRIEDAPPRRMAVRVPSALRLRTGGTAGSVEVHYGPAEAEIVLVDARNGFATGNAHGGEEDGASASGWGDGTPHVEAGVDLIQEPEEGPLDRTYRFEVFEFPRQTRTEGLVSPDRDRASYRVLWSRSLRVTATAEEMLALCGALPPRRRPEPEAVAATGADTGEIAIRVVDADDGAPVPGATVCWRKPVDEKGDWKEAWQRVPVPATTSPGEFRFRGRQGPHGFEVEAAEFVSAGVFDGVELEVVAGRTTERIVPLERAGSVRVEFRCEDRPVTPREATAWFRGFGKSEPVKDGVARWKQVPPGIARLDVDAGPEFDPLEDREIEVRPGEETQVVVRLDRRPPPPDATSGVRGTVTFHPRWGRGRTKVSIRPVEDRDAGIGAETEPFPCEPGEPAVFAVGRVPPGRYVLQVDPQWQEIVEVPEDGAHFDLRVPEPGVVRVRVLAEETGEDLRDATVMWFRRRSDLDTFPMDTRTWDSEARGFRFLAPPGEIVISARAPGRDLGGTEEGRIVLEAGREVECTIRLVIDER